MNKRKKKICALVIVSVMVIMSLAGCEGINNMISRMKGQLIGNSFDIYIYDNEANKVMNLAGKKVDVESVTDDSGEQSSYVDITIDGQQLLSVGSTIIFAETGLVPVEDFEINDYQGTEKDSTGFLPADRLINDIKNSIGTSKAIIVMSQLGVPIAVYQGDSVNMEVPNNLPKTTLISIDGKALYIHRANCVIVDKDLIA